MDKMENNIVSVEKVVGFILNILNPLFMIVVMILINDKIHSLVEKGIVEGVGYIFSGFTMLLPFFAKKIYKSISNKKQAEMVVYVLYNIPLIFGFIYFLLGGYLRYAVGFAIVTMGYYLFAGNFVFGEREND